MRPFFVVCLACVFLSFGPFCFSHSSSFSPLPDPKAVVVVGSTARFTVLTDSIVRIEWSEEGKFVDHATLAILNRRLPVPEFTKTEDDHYVYIETKFLRIRYEKSGMIFDADNLSVDVKRMGTKWNMTSSDEGNLLGTVRTLDGVKGSLELDCDIQEKRDELHCTKGLISRSGWVLLDDSDNAYFNGDPAWNWAEERQKEPTIDWYFLGHGHEYKLALSEFTLLAGQAPLPPRFVFGAWWSRYWSFNDRGLMQLVGEYDIHQVPLDVVIVDMNWHITFEKEAAQGKVDQAGQAVGWTGFTWDSHLFPKPKEFLDWCEARGIKNALNVHPASGVQPHELRYPEMARAMGIDPSTKKYVPFDIQNKTFAENMLKIMLEPLEEEGIDFWWLDWQQGEDWTSIPGVNPTFWLNYVFFTTQTTWKNDKRPMIFHRWGGLGNHRYAIGFSGDVVPAWESLQFQPYFTATAANVGYGYWSHDIGGHTQPCPAELYTRWVQWGSFSPIFRTHCTKQALNERRIWAFPLDNFYAMRDAMLTRFQLIPYIYTQAYQMHVTGLSFLRALYFEYPEHNEAYTYKAEYFFGDDIVVAPVTEAMDGTLQMTKHKMWIPPGRWVHYFTGHVFEGPIETTLLVPLNEIPVLVREGAVLPMQNVPDGGSGSLFGKAQSRPETLVFGIFMGNSTSGDGSVYEDDGDTQEFLENNSFATTRVHWEVSSEKSVSVAIDAWKGSFTGMEDQRAYDIVFHNVWPASSVSFDSYSIDIDIDMEMEIGGIEWSYNAEKLALTVHLPPQDVSSGVSIKVEFIAGLQNPTLLQGVAGVIRRLQEVKHILDDEFPLVFEEDYFKTLNLCETGIRVQDDLPSAVQEYGNVLSGVSDVVDEINAIGALVPEIKSQCAQMLLSV